MRSCIFELHHVTLSFGTDCESFCRFLHRDPNDPNDQGHEVTVEEYFARFKGILFGIILENSRVTKR